MLPPVRCFTCHLETGAVAEIYRKIRIRRMKKFHEETEIRPEYVSSVEMPHIMEGVLEDLQVVQCCRHRLTCAVDFRDVY